MLSVEMIMQKMVDSIKLSLKDRLNKVILYGSMARRDNSPESDFDCIVFVDSIDDEVMDAIDECAAGMLLNSGAVFSIIPVTASDFNELKFNPLYININREGVVLWQKTA
ncbi:MAG: hypothetical protein CVV49_07080 [Spirochaetae bacterium HGW-Spirochaetae-5]|nr:MAG: hypothetical protein CVV49_07080 [Spirochaetae bacterium HGW-Spirochaetae-5]